MTENIYQKQKRELEEIRKESFKQGIWKGEEQEREKSIKLINKFRTCNGDIPTDKVEELITLLGIT